MKIRKRVACCRLRVDRLTVKAPDSDVDRPVSLLRSQAPVVERAHMDSCFTGMTVITGIHMGLNPPRGSKDTKHCLSMALFHCIGDEG